MKRTIATVALVVMLAISPVAGVFGGGLVEQASADEADDINSGVDTSGLEVVLSEGFSGSPSDWPTGQYGLHVEAGSGDYAMLGDQEADNHFLTANGHVSGGGTWAVETTVETTDTNPSIRMGHTEGSNSLIDGLTVSVTPSSDTVSVTNADGYETLAETTSSTNITGKTTIGVKYDGGDMQVYVDGNKEIDTTVSTSVMGTQNLAVGTYTNNYNQHMKVYNLEVSTPPSTYEVNGTVTGSGGSAVEGATVTLTDSSGNELGTATTDSSGAYSVSGIENGTEVTAEVAATGYQTATKTATVDSATTMDFSLSPSTHELGGTVTDSSGNAVEGAEVTATDASGTQIGTATTGTNGGYSITGVEYGTEVTLSASDDGYDDASATVTVEGDTTRDLSLTRTTHAVTVEVTDGSGATIEGASVSLTDASGAELGSGTTDANGLYSVSGVEYGTDVTAEASADGYETTSSAATVEGDTTIGVSLAQSTFQLSGTVTDGNGTALENATVTIADASTGDGVATVETDGSGAWSVSSVKEGTYTVEAALDGYEAAEQTVEVAGSAATADLQLAEHATVSIETDPVATVTFLDADGNETATVEATDDGLAETTLPAGEYTVEVSADGETQTETVNASAGASEQLSVSFSEEETTTDDGEEAAPGGGSGGSDGGSGMAVLGILLALLLVSGALAARGGNSARRRSRDRRR